MAADHAAQPGVHGDLDCCAVEVTVEIVHEGLNPAVGDVVEGGVVTHAHRRSVERSARTKRHPTRVDAISRQRRRRCDVNVGSRKPELTPAFVTVHNSAAKLHERGLFLESAKLAEVKNQRSDFGERFGVDDFQGHNLVVSAIEAVANLAL